MLPAKNAAPSFSPEEESLLAQLGQLQTAPQEWMLPAIGWWLLLLAALITLIALAFARQRLQQRKRRKAYQHQASLLLKQLSQQQHNSADVNRLLKQVAMQTYGRARCANLAGQIWLDFLQQQQPALSQPDTIKQLLQHQSSAQSASLPIDVMTYCQAWVKACPLPSQALKSGEAHV